MKPRNEILLNPSPGMRHLKQERLLMTERSVSAAIPYIVIVATPRRASGNKLPLNPQVN